MTESVKIFDGRGNLGTGQVRTIAGMGRTAVRPAGRDLSEKKSPVLIGEGARHFGAEEPNSRSPPLGFRNKAGCFYAWVEVTPYARSLL